MTAPAIYSTPGTRPLRRTYISIALLANKFDVKWVMGQVGHADSKMTLDVYAQLEQRVDRSHGTSFDALIRGARGHDEAPAEPATRIGCHRFGTANGTGEPINGVQTPAGHHRGEPKNGSTTGDSAMELGGLEPPTSWVRCQVVGR